MMVKWSRIITARRMVIRKWISIITKVCLHLSFTSISIATLFLWWIQCRTQNDVVLFVMTLDLRLYEESVRNLKRAKQLRNKAQALLRRDERERRY